MMRKDVLTGAVVWACFCHARAFTSIRTSLKVHHHLTIPSLADFKSMKSSTFSPSALQRCPRRMRRKMTTNWRPQRDTSRLNMLDGTALFELQQWAGDVSATELTHVSPLTVGVMYGTGLLMSLSPCALSLLPLTISYIAGTEGARSSPSPAAATEDAGGFSSVKSGFIPSASFAAGLATVLSLLGLSATLAGRVMGNGNLAGGLGETLLPLGASVFAVAMGLNVLELVRVDLPSFEGGLDYITSLPRNARAFVLGASSALVASPCCTPVLASILGFVASSRDPALGLLLLLSYSAGYTTPLIAAGTASGVLSSMMSAKGLNWITPLSGAMLISYGTYTGLDTLLG